MRLLFSTHIKIVIAQSRIIYQIVTFAGLQKAVYLLIKYSFCTATPTLRNWRWSQVKRYSWVMTVLIISSGVLCVLLLTEGRFDAIQVLLHQGYEK